MNKTKNIILAAAVFALVVSSMAVNAGHDGREGQYNTAGNQGDFVITCTADDTVVWWVWYASGVVIPDPGTGISWEDEFGWCLGGYGFGNLTADGQTETDWLLSVTDDNAPWGPSGAHRVHTDVGGVYSDNFDTCYDVDHTVEIPDDGNIAIWIDGVLWWALGSPCGEVTDLGQGTIGTIELDHL